MAGCQVGRSPSMLAAHNCIWIIELTLFTHRPMNRRTDRWTDRQTDRNRQRDKLSWWLKLLLLCLIWMTFTRPENHGTCINWKFWVLVKCVWCVCVQCVWAHG